MPTARAGIAGATLDGYLFVFGGEEVGEQVFEEVEAYHPPTDTWTTVEPLPTPRWGLGAATLDGRVYTIGGGAIPSAKETKVLEIMEPIRESTVTTNFPGGPFHHPSRRPSAP